MAIVNFNYADVKPVSLRGKKAIQDFVAGIFLREGKFCKKINYIFCSDDFLLEINQSYLKHDYYTDIITFDLSEGDGVIGEIYISVDRVKENSQIHRCGFTHELLRVIFHGALHLAGYKDKKKSEITVMREKEDEYLRLFGSK